MSQAFYSYAKAEELVKRNPEAFSKEDRLVELEKIKKFYDQNGYIYECRKIRKEMLELTQQTFQSDSVELAMCYHDIGYAYERFRYYKFMLKAMKKSKDILQHVIKKLGCLCITVKCLRHIATFFHRISILHQMLKCITNYCCAKVLL